MTRELLLSFHVAGVPVPQGSKTVFNGRAVDANAKKLRPWRRHVTATARAAMVAAGLNEPLDGPLVLAQEFVFERPKSVKRAHPSVKPDGDKLLRALCDALTDAGVWRDDSQMVQWPGRKVYGPNPGVQVSVYREKE
ncbi:RusA family crossover junction endodeoxyribonuclease [Leucobacter sp. NPDC058333]|uniref:RusA family crossover junction endodeoxyribonuclease n=1 Tax=Leucobacter sp. NPDC058333 TaxID=3346450 RepID=UPI00366400D9